MTEPALETLGVVPIVVNAGAAALPALLAGIVSVLAIVFKPREWIRISRERPYVPVLLLMMIAIGVLVYMWSSGPSDAPAGPRARAPTAGSPVGSVDWTAVASTLSRHA
ncbi:hypothetical protein QQ054_04595 [Oscillatoria amoena NRMC-F 0135]|nr:hypothetical protein [Oscillatoria amoena NRMC-F 0135]